MATLTTLPPEVPQKLDALRRRVYLWLALSGAAFLVLSLFGLLALDLVVDWYFRMDRVQRAVCLFLGVAVATLVVYRRLVRPLSRAIGEETLALRVEATYPELGQGLISALQFTKWEDPASLGVSPALIAATVEAGARRAEPLDFAQAVGAGFRRRTLRRSGLALGAAALVVATFAVPLTAGTMRTWLHRNLLLREIYWPQYTHLLLQDLEDGTLSLPRGDDFDQKVLVTGIVPSAVYLDIDPEVGSWFSQEMVQVGSVEKTGEMIGRHEAGKAAFRSVFRNVLEPFRFRVRGGDAETPWIRVRLVDRPRVEKLELVYTPPAYTKLPPAVLPAGEGGHEVLKGGSLQIAGQANKALAKAELYLGDKPLQPLDVTAPPGSAAGPGDPRGFGGRIAPAQLTTGQFGLYFLDTDRLSSKRLTRFGLKVVPDRKPLVRASLQGVSGIVTARALVPLLIKVTDDYGIAGLALVHRIGLPTTGEQPGEKTPPQSRALPGLGAQLGGKALSTRYGFDLRPLSLVVGAQVSFQVEARDFDDVSGPNVGTSSNFFLKVVTEDELRAELLRREQEQRQEFERLKKDQEELLTDCKALMLGIKGKPLPEAERQVLSRAEKRQRLTRDRCDGIAEQFGGIYLEVQNNRLEAEDAALDAPAATQPEEGPVQRRLRTNIIEPLRLLAKEPVPLAADLLDFSRKGATSIEDRDKALAAATARQQEIVARMQEILRHMVRWEGYQEAVNLLHEILKAQGDVSEATRKEMERRIQEVFGGEEKK